MRSSLMYEREPALAPNGASPSTSLNSFSLATLVKANPEYCRGLQEGGLVAIHCGFEEVCPRNVLCCIAVQGISPCRQ
jgi:hypothetical protein